MLMERKTSPQAAKSLWGGRKGGRYDIGCARCSTNETEKYFQKMLKKPFDSGVIFPSASRRPS